jgi:hypothetical protein
MMYPDTRQSRRLQNSGRVTRRFNFLRKGTVTIDLVQGVIIGAVLAFITANLLINAAVHRMQTTVNGWSTTFKCGKFGDEIPDVRTQIGDQRNTQSVPQRTIMAL